MVSAGERIGSTLLLDDDTYYGPGLLEYFATTPITRVGFPSSPGRYQVVALRAARGDLMSPFRPCDYPTARFIHLEGFLAVFADRSVPAKALMASATDSMHDLN